MRFLRRLFIGCGCWARSLAGEMAHVMQSRAEHPHESKDSEYPNARQSAKVHKGWYTGVGCSKMGQIYKGTHLIDDSAKSPHLCNMYIYIYILGCRNRGRIRMHQGSSMIFGRVVGSSTYMLQSQRRTSHSCKSLYNCAYLHDTAGLESSSRKNASSGMFGTGPRQQRLRNVRKLSITA